MKHRNSKPSTNGKKKPVKSVKRPPLVLSPSEYAHRQCFGRDRVSNGTRLIEGLDKRTVEFRRWKFLFESQRSRVGPQHEQLCRAYATAVLRREQLDADVCNAKNVDPVALTRLCSLITRLTAKLDAQAERKPDPAAEAQRQRELAEAGLD